MHDSADLTGGTESTARLRAEAVAMLSEQAASCRPPTTADATADAASEAAPGRRPAPPRDIRPLPLSPADTAALLRELRSLGEDEPPQVAPAEPAAPQEPVPVRVRRGAFRRSRPA